MPEFYKKIVATQFQLTDDEKTQVRKGEPVSFDGQPVRFIGDGRFQLLYPVGDLPVPVREGQWIVRNTRTEIVSDHDFQATYTPVNNQKS